MKKKFIAVGLMSGTSLDGLDAVLARLAPSPSGFDVRVLGHVHRAFPHGWAEEIRRISERDRLRDAARFGAAWSEFAARTVRALLSRCRYSVRRVDVIGAHGQTVVHEPAPKRFLGKPSAISIQLADLSRLAQRMGIPVVGNFRTADLAAGGQGAPLAPHAHRMLFGSRRKIVAVQNLGGIGNVTLLKNGKVTAAFDTGPANVWIDTVARWRTKGKLTFDKNGATAARGNPDFPMVGALLRHPFLRVRPPKSAGWEQFGPASLAKFRARLLKMPLADALATVTVASALATAIAYRRFVLPKGNPSEILLCGGGARNATWRRLFAHALPEIPVTTTEARGLPVDQVEAVACAILAVQTLRGFPSNEPTATGAERPVILGQLAFL
ncbi:MAG: anhydro-N-acetylmuramic acid kinase [Pseudomonadota bacterium]